MTGGRSKAATFRFALWGKGGRGVRRGSCEQRICTYNPPGLSAKCRAARCSLGRAPNPRHTEFAPANPVCPSSGRPTASGSPPDDARRSRDAKTVPRRKEETNARRQPCERRTTTIIKENRTRKIIIRVTDSELAAIRANAATAGLTLSRYARQRMLLQPIIPTIPAEVQQLRADVTGLCNNINQIARAVNAMAREPAKAAEEAVLLSRQAYQSVEQIRELIARGV